MLNWRNTMARILVVGASGTVGSELSRLLAHQGHDVRRGTSKAPTEPGQVALDVVGRAGIAEAFEGVARAFLLCPPGFTNQDELLKPLIDEAGRRKLEKVVLMSAMGANADENAPLRKAERHLEQAGVPYHIIRPNWFMQNFQTFWLQGIVGQDKIFLPVGNAKGSFIDTRDVAAVAASLLTRDDVTEREFDLTGPEALDHHQIAAILSREVGRTITYEDIPPEAMRAGLLGAGLPADYVEFLLLILGFFKAGYSEHTTGAVESILGRRPITFEQYARDNRAAWVK
jgi:uncharacterized protein YbjT (DUF2867 family)